MAKDVKKIKDEQLEELQGKLKMIDSIRLQVGTLENQKFAYLSQMAAVQQELNQMQNDLQDEYGKVSINITDGTITEIPEEDEADKKD
jgi:chaperonin cofactor prefoldin|tara:strand:- start:740 stop:1003 length:264 start_codon:yes stop_codon:yes gene_type:complete